MGPRSTAAVKKALEALQEPRETGAGQAGAPRQKRAVAPGQEAPLAFLWRGHQIEAAVTTNTDARHSNARWRVTISRDGAFWMIWLLPGERPTEASLACALDEHVVRQATKGKSSV